MAEKYFAATYRRFRRRSNIFRFIFVALLISFTSYAFALNPGGGFTILEEGDDRLHPAVHGSLEFEEATSKLHYYATRKGPVTRRIYILEAYKLIDLFSQFGVGGVMAKAGVNALHEHYAIEFFDDKKSSSYDDTFNIGASLGLSYRFLKTPSFVMDLDWTSHLYLAGLSSIALSTGRMQTWSLTASWVMP